MVAPLVASILRIAVTSTTVSVFIKWLLDSFRNDADNHFLEYYNKLHPDEQYLTKDALLSSNVDMYDYLNAYEHAYTSAKLTYYVSYEFAYILGISKELITWGTEPSEKDRQRDLWNNDIGGQNALKAKENNKDFDTLSEEIFTNIFDPDTDYIVDPYSTDKKYLDDMTIGNLLIDPLVCRLGFNPTETIKEIKNVA